MYFAWSSDSEAEEDTLAFITYLLLVFSMEDCFLGPSLVVLVLILILCLQHCETYEFAGDHE